MVQVRDKKKVFASFCVVCGSKKPQNTQNTQKRFVFFVFSVGNKKKFVVET